MEHCVEQLVRGEPSLPMQVESSMGKAKGKQRQGEYYHLAKEQGYRSRAAFKLQQLDDRFRFHPPTRGVLDLCAAPGGWMQVVVARAPVGAFLVGVDLMPIRPVRGAHSLTEDITTTKCRSAVRRLMDSKGVTAFDVVLHDGSPNVGGTWATATCIQPPGARREERERRKRLVNLPAWKFFFPHHPDRQAPPAGFAVFWAKTQRQCSALQISPIVGGFLCPASNVVLICYPSP
ncbi:unnamed protein product [Triticum turgidum subsp. durum]|uniref:Ribosomal RNA methyltransferase FtsJ domain-containing protein n=1 Tax=Triticum turgidum subsp. durum TaxID=4567 RepID=A0A9R1QH44_TRITD|nr:unnamed protein product [Triticum turgidum subsp. durum]